MGGPNNKDYSILGSILGSPYFGKLAFYHNSPMNLGVKRGTSDLRDTQVNCTRIALAKNYRILYRSEKDPCMHSRALVPIPGRKTDLHDTGSAFPEIQIASFSNSSSVV